MYFFRTAGTGRVLEVPQSSLQQAKELFKSSSSEAPDLPTGADWPVLPLVNFLGFRVAKFYLLRAVWTADAHCLRVEVSHCCQLQAALHQSLSLKPSPSLQNLSAPAIIQIKSVIRRGSSTPPSRQKIE